MSNAPRYSFAELAHWAGTRATAFAAMLDAGDLPNADAATRREFLATCERDAKYLAQITAILSRLSRTHEASHADWQKARIDGAVEYGTERNFFTALSVVIESHTDAHAFALLLFRQHDDGRLSVEPVANIPRAALHESLGQFFADKTFLHEVKR